MADTIQCKHCGEINNVGAATCANCHTPLTAYGGQVGQEEHYTTRSDAQLQALEQRPPIVVGVMVFNVLFALAVPLWSVITAWTTRPKVNAEGTNAIQSATGTIVPIVYTLTLLPVAAVLCIIAYFTWTQRSWAWTANAVVLGGIALLAFLLHGFAVMTFLWIAFAGGFAYFWFQKPVKAWFALE